MKVVILAGGKGTRLAEETEYKPKPMVEIGGRPILWHIMKIYSKYGYNDFVICCGYKGYQIKEYFINYFQHNSDITVDLANNTVETLGDCGEPWRITLVDTGEETMTAGRLRRIKNYVSSQPRFLMTYGDGVADINIKDLVDNHAKGGKMVTMTAVSPPSRFGHLDIGSDNSVKSFIEKPSMNNKKINGGFFVIEKEALNFIKSDDCVFEQDTLNQIVQIGGLRAYEHDGFWHPMDTLRDKLYLDRLAESGAPWFG